MAYTRDLVNTAAQRLCPADASPTSVKAARRGQHGQASRSSTRRRSAKGGFGGILGVGQGSANPPRLVKLTYSRRRRPKATLALVGKGITFDSGGMCIKPAAGMLTMKSDMAGAAAVAADRPRRRRARACPVAVTGYLCLAENMPTGTAQRPGDVVTMHGGKTVEILNTDAEGRMVLGDALVPRRRDQARRHRRHRHADRRAGGRARHTGSPGSWATTTPSATRVRAAADGAGEAVWPMPLPEDLRAELDSTVADIAHKGERWGGMLTAGCSCRSSSREGIPWAHIDIAGPSFNEGGPFGYTPKGGTGFGVRTLLALAEATR